MLVRKSNGTEQRSSERDEVVDAKTGFLHFYIVRLKCLMRIFLPRTWIETKNSCLTRIGMIVRNHGPNHLASASQF
jgi:hypothetical protein